MKVKLPNWKGLHMDQAIYWSELFRLNPRLFNRSYSFDDFCRRISPQGKLSLGAYMAKHKWAANVFTACKLGKTGLAHALTFPEVNKFSELFNADGSPNAKLAAWLKENMLEITGGHYTEVIKRSDGFLIVQKYNCILGSRYLALLPTTARIPKNVRVQQ
jgi:hypothetical protein